MLIDETALLLQPLWRRGWAPRGQPPSVRSTARKARWTLIGALTVSPRRQRMGLYFQAIAGNANTELFVHFVLQLQRSLGKPLLVIWDGLPSHKKAARLLQQRFDERFRFETLPPYSPQLNPVEWLWSELTWNRLHSRPPRDLQDLRARAEDCLLQIGSEQHLLRSFFHGANLSLEFHS